MIKQLLWNNIFKHYFLIWLFVMGWFLSGCTVLSSKGVVAFEKFQALQEEDKTKSDVLRSLGEPQKMVFAKDLSENIDAWVYLDRDGGVRLTALFEPVSEAIISLRWNVRESDELKTYAHLSARYPLVDFVKNVPPQGRICTAPSYCERSITYSDASTGVWMAAETDGGVIDDVGWRNPGISWEPTLREKRYKSCFQ